MTLQAFFLLLLTQTTLSSTNGLVNTIWTKFKNSTIENPSNRKDLIINGITGKITNRDWRKQVNQLRWPLNGWLSDAPTNVIKCKLYCRTGYHLQIRRNGVVSGSLNQKSKYSKCMIRVQNQFPLQEDNIFCFDITNYARIRTILWFSLSNTGNSLIRSLSNTDISLCHIREVLVLARCPY
jgi:hypothetical protein